VSDDANVHEAVCRECWRESEYCVRDPHSGDEICPDCADDIASKLRDRRDSAHSQQSASDDESEGEDDDSTNLKGGLSFAVLQLGVTATVAYYAGEYAATGQIPSAILAGTITVLLAALTVDTVVETVRDYYDSESEKTPQQQYAAGEITEDELEKLLESEVDPEHDRETERVVER